MQQYTSLNEIFSDSDNSDLVYKSCGILVNVTKFKDFHEKLPPKIVSKSSTKTEYWWQDFIDE